MKPVLKKSTTDAISALDSMWDRVDSVRMSLQGDYVEERPAGSFTAAEYCRRYNLPGATGQHQIESMLRRGIIRRYRTLLPDGLSRMVIHNVYHLTETAANKG